MAFEKVTKKRRGRTKAADRPAVSRSATGTSLYIPGTMLAEDALSVTYYADREASLIGIRIVTARDEADPDAFTIARPKGKDGETDYDGRARVVFPESMADMIPNGMHAITFEREDDLLVFDVSDLTEAEGKPERPAPASDAEAAPAPEAAAEEAPEAPETAEEAGEPEWGAEAAEEAGEGEDDALSALFDGDDDIFDDDAA